jgi:asparagine synthetase B (glutamine-hydrolysing)
MSKMLGILGEASRSIDRPSLLETINPLSSAMIRSLDFDAGWVAASYLKTAPLVGERILETEDEIVGFCGDLVGTGSIPWKAILAIFRKKDYPEFGDWRGRFAVSHYQKKEKTITLVSDRRSQQPLYYRPGAGAFCYSTELSSFCRLPEPMEFDSQWLYEYFFFNYPVGKTTFLKGVFKLPPASVLQYSLPASAASLSGYAASFRPKPRLLTAPESFQRAASVFRETLPPYFDGSEEIACALTSGWDGRTILAHAPDRTKITTYTYGVPGCQDLRDAKMTAKKLGVRHQSVSFGEEYLAGLADAMIDTVFLSSGSEKILRASLLYVYRTLTAGGTRFPLIMSGIGMDGIFRGHSLPPAIVSWDMADVFRNGRVQLREPFWREVLADGYPLFREKILEKMDWLQQSFGDFDAPRHHLLFKLYVTHPELFGGELKIAENFATVRVPAWDDDLIDLAFSIKESGLSFSEFSGHKRGDRAEVRMQAYILEQCSPALARIPIGKTRPDILGKGSLYYQAYRIYRGFFNRFKALTSRYSPLEDWEKWLSVTHRGFLDDLVFSSGSLIRDYVGRDFLANIERSRDIHWMGKLGTAEIVLRLIKKHWHKSF